MALYEEIALYVEDIVDKNNGSKVAVRGYSGGTINSYAFLMSQPEEWRKAHVLAYIVSEGHSDGRCDIQFVVR